MDPERLVERTLFASRWLLVPLYFGLALILILFSIYFARELWELAQDALTLTEKQILIASLDLIDLSLVGGLIVMVMLSGYENFVSRLDIEKTERSISWLGKLDSGSLKLKVSASIVAISAIQLLKVYMEADSVADDKLFWMTIIHLTFVVSALVLAVTERIMLAKENAGSH
jgi:uncharacterized protein (TIGR00645 family)